MYVCIVGGGVGGLALALSLADAGITDVEVYESAAAIAELGVGINILPHAVRELSELGLLEELTRTGIATAEWAMYSKLGQLIWSEPRGEAAGYRWPQFSIHRGQLVGILHRAVVERLGLERVHTGNHFEDFEATDGGVSCRFVSRTTDSNAAQVVADLLVGCDGIHSTVRQRLYPNEGPPKWNGTTMWRAVTEGTAFLSGRTHIAVGGGGRSLVVYPISESRERPGPALINWVANLRTAADGPMPRQDWSHVAEVGEIREAFSSFRGVTVFPADDGDAESLIAHADIAMYRAKELGRDGYQLYTPAMNESILERLALENDLRHALQREEMVVYYQPLVDTASRRIVGMEALLRWRHPDRGLVMPDTFIPIAEETRLILPLGEWVLREACAQTKLWQSSSEPELQISVNLSPLQFQQMDLISKVFEALAESGLDAKFLCLEITESTAIRDVDYTIALLKQLKEIGVRVAIDDFGTGHSGLSHLNRLPVDVLKVDKSFVSEIASNHREAEITRTVIALAHGLGLQVVAEGVESEEQAAFLEKHQCDELQGYLFSKPMPAEYFDVGLFAGMRRHAA